MSLQPVVEITAFPSDLAQPVVAVAIDCPRPMLDDAGHLPAALVLSLLDAITDAMVSAFGPGDS